MIIPGQLFHYQKIQLTGWNSAALHHLRVASKGSHMIFETYKHLPITATKSILTEETSPNFIGTWCKKHVSSIVPNVQERVLYIYKCIRIFTTNPPLKVLDHWGICIVWPTFGVSMKVSYVGFFPPPRMPASGFVACLRMGDSERNLDL